MAKIYRGKDLTGKQVGYLVVTAPTDLRSKTQSRIWLCQCACGKQLHVAASSLSGARHRRTHCGCKHFVGPTHKNWKGYGEICGQYWVNLKYTARQRHLKFTITIQEAWDKFLEQHRRCTLTGLLLTHGDLTLRRELRFTQKTASIDRIDSAKGYVSGNIQWIHKDVNYLKNKFSNERFIELCKLVAEHTRPVAESCP
jgi:hypothetical protein